MESFVSVCLLGNAGEEIFLFLWRSVRHGWDGFWLPLRWFARRRFRIKSSLK